MSISKRLQVVTLIQIVCVYSGESNLNENKNVIEMTWTSCSGEIIIG